MAREAAASIFILVAVSVCAPWTLDKVNLGFVQLLHVHEEFADSNFASFFDNDSHL